jgi:hypothetical protein
MVNTSNFTFLDTRRKGTDSKLNYINKLICSNFFVNVILLLSLPNILIMPHFTMTYHHLSLQWAVIKSQFVVSIMFRIISLIRLTYIIQQTRTNAVFMILSCTLVSSRPYKPRQEAGMSHSIHAIKLCSLTLKFATFLSVLLMFKSQLVV